MNFLQWAVWGAYLTSMSNYLSSIGLAEKIGLFYSTQGIVSIFMPAIIGIIADRYVPAQRLLGICHLIAGAAMVAAGYYGMSAGADVKFGILFPMYALSVAFYMPTIAPVQFSGLQGPCQERFRHGEGFPSDKGVRHDRFHLLHVPRQPSEGCDGVQFQSTYNQFFVSGAAGLLLFLYSFTLPDCPCAGHGKSQSLAEALGIKAFRLFKDRGMLIFFLFSMLLGVALQITNGFANPYIQHFENVPEFRDSWWVEYSNILISISQMSETLGILLIPFAMKFFGIKKVMLIAMVAWVFRFGLLGAR